MILTPIVDYFRIEKLEQLLVDTMSCQAHVKKVRHIIGWKSGQIEDDVFWSKQYSIWSYFRTLENRYWNIFGTEDPEKKSKHSALRIDCEICVYTKDPDKKVAGVFAINIENIPFLIHTGKVGGGKPGWGKTEFWKRWQIYESQNGDYQPVIVNWPSGKDKAILISQMTRDPGLFQRVAGFVWMEHRLQGD